MNKNVFRAIFAVGAIAILALLAPVIWALVSAGVGLVVLGVIGIVGLGIIQMLPMLGQKLENFVLKTRKAEARANPIEQLQNFFIEKQQRVVDFRKAIISIKTQIETLRQKVQQRKRQKPNYDSSDEDNAIAQMSMVYDKLEQKYLDAKDALANMEEMIEEKKFKWEFSQAGQAAIQALSATSGEELLSKILADEASSSVLDNFNKVFAELELEACNLTEAKQIAFDDNRTGLTLDVSSINLSKVKS